MRVAVIAVLMLASTAFAAPKKKPVIGQKEIAPARALEIQKALVSHGYSVEVTGAWDRQTKVALYRIADDMEWQVNHVPDARVLILLGLGNPMSNPEVATQKGNQNDRDQRADKSLKNALDK
jgi:hypothetical protein